MDFRAYKRVRAEDAVIAAEMGLHEYPQSDGIINAIKRAKQAVAVKWTPMADLPRVYSLDGRGDANSRFYKGYFKEGIEYHGVPYSMADYSMLNNYGYTSGEVGSYISYETFLSAVRNKDSIFYDVVVDEDHYRSTLYGLVCYSLVSNSFNLPANETYKMTQNMNPRLFKRIAATIGDADPNLIRVGSFVQSDTHVALITDIIRDSSGVIQYIEVTEATRAGNANRNIVGGQTGGIARSRLWSFSEFMNQYSTFALQMYMYIDDVPYDPDKATTLKEETERYLRNDFPCVPYVGNKFTYRKNYLYNKDILIDTTEFTHLRVVKDAELFDMIEINGADKVSVNFTDEGYYEAYLCNIDENEDVVYGTVSCQWCVVDDTTTAELTGDTINIVTTVDANDVPYIVRVVPYSSSAKYRSSTMRRITNAEVETLENGKKRYTFSVTRFSNTENAIRVEYQGKYNKWHGDWIQLS